MEGLRIDEHPGPDLLDSLSNDALAGFDALINDPVVSDGLAESHGPNAHLVIAADNCQLARALQIEDCLLRYEQRFTVHVNGGAHFGVLAGTQNIARIWEYPGNANGARPDIDLAVREVYFTLLRICSPVCQNKFEAHARALRGMFPE